MPRHLFEKGKSGNPAGRPRDGESMSAIMKEYLNEEEDGKPRKIRYIEKVWELAMSGNIPAIREIWNRMEGKPQESIKLSGDSEEQLKITLVDARTRNTTPGTSE